MKTKKILALALAAVLLVAVSVAGTVAYLTAVSPEVTNTFTESDISVDLKETVPTNQTAQVIPGVDIPKDPKVTVTSNIDCYVFVRITEDLTASLTWDIADGWNELDGVDNVYWRKYDFTNAPATNSWYVLKDNEIVVSGDLSNTEMASIKANNPTMKFESWAVQFDAMEDEAAAWATLNVQ